LLGEGFELAGGDGINTLYGPSGRECPAGTTLALVLHRGYGVLGGPVDGCWCGGDVKDGLCELWLLEGVVAGHGALEFV